VSATTPQGQRGEGMMPPCKQVLLASESLKAGFTGIRESESGFYWHQRV